MADVDANLFDAVDVFAARPGFAAVPPGAARESAPVDCQHLSRLAAKDGPELDVEYRPATDANGTPFDNRLSRGGESVHLRVLVAGEGNDLIAAMAAWAHQCPMWGIARTMDDNGVEGWQVAESGEKLTRYQAGDIDGQWPYVTHMAATVHANGVIVQAWYRTTDPSATSRNHTLSQLIRAAGRPRPRSALPPNLADWSLAQISTLLPPLSTDTSIEASTNFSIATSSVPGGPSWSLCPSDNHGSTPHYDPLASWQDFDQSKWDQQGKPPRPFVIVKHARVGVDYLADLRSEIANCTAHLSTKPSVCADRQNHQFLQADSAVAEGEDTVRLTHRWMRTLSVRGHDMCSEGVEAMRVSQVRGLIIISSSNEGGLFGADTPPLALNTLDELLAETVRRVKAA